MNLQIENGEFVAILGPSGCGKSTTLFLLAGLYAPSGGAISFDGHNVNRIDARDRNVGIVFQSYALYPNLTVRENIAFPLRFKTMGKEESARRGGRGGKAGADRHASRPAPVPAFRRPAAARGAGAAHW